VKKDGIGQGTTEELLEAGVKPEEIILAFHRPSQRKHLPFAVA
jgi:hypothetical protein